MEKVAWINTRTLIWYSPYGMAFEGQEEPFSRLDKAVYCDESSSHRRALHIPVQILAGKFKMEVLPTISLTKVFPVAQICPNLHKIVPSSKANP